MNLLLTNDDGVDAAGLAALLLASESLGHSMIVAPERCHSGGGHQVTTHEPIRLSRRDDTCYAIDGTPADCVRVALEHLARKTDWVLFAGINHGGNLGADLYMSGTAAADREECCTANRELPCHIIIARESTRSIGAARLLADPRSCGTWSHAPVAARNVLERQPAALAGRRGRSPNRVLPDRSLAPAGRLRNRRRAPHVQGELSRAPAAAKSGDRYRHLLRQRLDFDIDREGLK